MALLFIIESTEKINVSIVKLTHGAFLFVNFYMRSNEMNAIVKLRLNYQQPSSTVVCVSMQITNNTACVSM